MKHGEFCKLFGDNPRNKILEFFLEMRELDFSIGDIAKETGLNRATTYNNINLLEKEKLIIKSRKISGGQLYKLNKNNKEVKFLMKVFNIVLEKVIKEVKSKNLCVC